MPATLTGNLTGVVARQDATTTKAPAAGDERKSLSIRDPLQDILNLAQFLMKKGLLLDALNTAFNGTGTDTDPLLDTTTAPTSRKLLWRAKCATGYFARLYSEAYNGTTLLGGLTLTFNAGWNGTNWVPDTANVNTALRINEEGVVMGRAAAGGAFSDASFFGSGRIVLPTFGGAVTLDAGTLLGIAEGDNFVTLGGDAGNRIRKADTTLSSMLNGWTAGTGSQAPKGFIDAFGYVTLQGLISGIGGPATAGDAITLPAAFTPTKDVELLAPSVVGATDGIVKVTIWSASHVLSCASLSGLAFNQMTASLDGIRYRAAS